MFTITLGEAPADIAASLSVDVFYNRTTAGGARRSRRHAFVQRIGGRIRLRCNPGCDAGRRYRGGSGETADMVSNRASGARGRRRLGVGVEGWDEGRNLGDRVVMIEHREGVEFRVAGRTLTGRALVYGDVSPDFNGALCAGKSFTRASRGDEFAARFQHDADRAGCIHPERFGAGA